MALRLTVARVPRRPKWPWWGVVIFVGWLALVWITHRVEPDAVVCNLKRTTGVPCPTCGLTRGVTAIVEQGDVPRGLSYNPLIMTAGIVFLLLLAARLALGRTVRVKMSRRERTVTLWSFVALFLANWAYIIVFVG